jgi:thiol-disulfide isomerase/thioredoxin
VPAVEAVAAAGLLVDRTAVAAAVLAAALMLVFGVAIARALRQDRQPDCNCFGQLRSVPIGRGLLARNALFAAAAILVASGGPGDSIPPALIGAGLVGVGGFLAATYRPRHAPRVGDSAPPLEGLERALQDGLPIAIVFVSPDCGPCKTLVPELERWSSALAGRLNLLAVDARTATFGTTTPSALIVSPDGRVASGTATGVVGVQALVRSQLM